MVYNTYQPKKEEPTKATTNSGTTSLSPLLEKMRTYQNYQLDLVITAKSKDESTSDVTESGFAKRVFGSNWIDAVGFDNNPPGWTEVTEGLVIKVGILSNQGYLSPKQLVDKGVELTKQTYPGIEVKTEEVLVGGTKGYKESSSQGNIIYLPFKDKDKAVEITFLYRGKKSTAYAKIVELMLSTFRFD